MDITYDELDAVLQDPQVPGDVRAAVQTEIAVRNYLSRVDFHVSDTGVTSVQHRTSEDIPPISEAAPSSAQQASTLPAETATPPDSPTGAQAPTDPAPTDPTQTDVSSVPPANPDAHPVEVSAEVTALSPEQRAALRAELDAADNAGSGS